MRTSSLALVSVGVLAAVISLSAALPVLAVDVDLAGYDRSHGVQVSRDDDTLTLRWPMAGDEWGTLELGIAADDERALVRALRVSPGSDERGVAIVENVDPTFILTVGKRDLSKRNGWTIFFDKVHQRPYRSAVLELDIDHIRVTSRERRATVAFARVKADSFSGELEFTVYCGSPLVQVEAVVSIRENAAAIVYDAAMSHRSAPASASKPAWARVGWIDTDGELHRDAVSGAEPATPFKARHRTIVAENDAGSIAVFPPPHRYFYPLDLSDNLKFVWSGRGYRELVSASSVGIRHQLDGDRRFVPWFNAPPGTKQRLGMFWLLSRGSTESAIESVTQYTNGDRFRRLDGHLTFTSHYHVEHTTDLVNRQGDDFSGNPDDIRIPADLRTPGFVKVFRGMGIDIVHLAEFHFGRTPGLGAAKRLPLLELLHRECARLSDDSFLLLPGEEPNVHLGGHWISFFPKSVYWVLNRRQGEPFVRDHPRLGKVYHVGSAEDVLRLLELEGGLAWTAHPRIKSSTGYPDRYREREFYLSDRFLGAAWKAMPADLSRPRLGERVLDLLDDMANWGQEKYALGEVDTFRANPDHEQYAHMNVNYLRLDTLPRFEDGWQPVLDALRGGRFFVTTGEILLPEFKVAGKRSGEPLSLEGEDPVEIELAIEWTFPLEFAEIISGDGERVHRRRIDLAGTEQFSKRTFRLREKLAGRRWVRAEVWDIATNGAFTQPVWLR